MLQRSSWPSSAPGSVSARSFISLLASTILLTTACLCIALTLFVWNPHAWNLRFVSQCVVANSNDATFPVVFAENLSYASIETSSDKLWETLVPSNGGLFTKLDDHGERVAHGFSMFHQLHCLGKVRTALQDAFKPGIQVEEDVKSEESNEGPEWHVLHCLDYLRQAILCIADDNDEPPTETESGGTLIDGLSEHQCRDASVLYERSERDSPEIAELMAKIPMPAVIIDGMK